MTLEQELNKVERNRRRVTIGGDAWNRHTARMEELQALIDESQRGDQMKSEAPVVEEIETLPPPAVIYECRACHAKHPIEDDPLPDKFRCPCRKDWCYPVVVELNGEDTFLLDEDEEE